MKSINLDDYASITGWSTSRKITTVQATKRDILRAALPLLRQIEKDQKGAKKIYHSYWLLDHCEALINEKGDTV